MERVLIIKLAKQSLQLLETLTQAEQEACDDEEGMFEKLNKKFKPQYNETRKPLKFHNLVRQYNESMEEWMCRLRTTVMECNC